MLARQDIFASTKSAVSVIHKAETENDFKRSSEVLLKGNDLEVKARLPADVAVNLFQTGLGRELPSWGDHHESKQKYARHPTLEK